MSAEDPESAPFWAAVRDKELGLQRCAACGKARFPPLPACPYCGSVDGAWEVASGRGRVYSWVRVHRAFAPQFADDVPYTVAVVELDEGPRMLARLDPHADIGAPVTVHFHDDGERTELRFGTGPS